MLQGGCGWSNFSYSSGGNAIAPESRCYFRGRLHLLASSGRTNQKMWSLTILGFCPSNADNVYDICWVEIRLSAEERELHVSVLIVHGHGERLAQHLLFSLHIGQQLVTILNKVLTLAALEGSEGQQLQSSLLTFQCHCCQFNFKWIFII